MYCPKCRAPNDINNQVCANCGTPLPQPFGQRPTPAPMQNVYCTNCGAVNDPRSSACVNCGTPLHRVAQPAGYLPPVERISKGKYLGSIIAGIVVGMIFIAGGIVVIVVGSRSSYGGEPESGTIVGGVLLLLVGIAASIYASIMEFVFWYKCWKAIQDGYARATPAKAIGFLFIPFYNFYWIFECYWGFSKDFNMLVDRHNLGTRKLPEGLFLTACILTLVGVIPYAGYVASLASGIIHLVMISQACDAVNSLAPA